MEMVRRDGNKNSSPNKEPKQNRYWHDEKTATRVRRKDNEIKQPKSNKLTLIEHTGDVLSYEMI